MIVRRRLVFSSACCITKKNMRMLRAFNSLSYQNSTNETYLQNVSISTKARNYRILYVRRIYHSINNLKK